MTPILVALSSTEELAPRDTTEVNSHTFLGLGLIAGALVVIWLIRRLRA